MNLTPARMAVDRFVQDHAGDGFTLDIGSRKSPYARYFPRRISVDYVASGRGLDVAVQGDAHALPFADSAFDNVVCTEVLEHLQRPWVALAEMRRVLKADGRLILTTRFMYRIHAAPYDYWRFTMHGLEFLLQNAGFHKITIREDTTPMGTIGQFVDFSISKWLAPLWWPIWTAYRCVWRLRLRKGPHRRNEVPSGYLCSASATRDDRPGAAGCQREETNARRHPQPIHE